MNSLSNRVLIITLAVCALSVIASSHLAEMHGQEKVTRPVDVVAEPTGDASELPGRSVVDTDDSEPPILYGNQTPFGQLPDSSELKTDTSVDSESNQPQRQTVNRQNYDLFTPDPQTEGLLPERTADPGALELIQPEITQGVVEQPATPSVMAPSPAMALPGTAIPSSTLPVQVLDTVPVTALDVAPVGGCSVCGSKTCTICCQPKCITQKILIPQYHTVWSSIFETRYRTEVKEEAYTIEQEVEHQVPRIIQETVMVAEPRITTFQDFREVEEQYPVEEPYTVMVRKPRQRMVPVEREETYRFPVEQEYTVMEPQEKIVAETKYKTIIDEEPRQKKYTEEVDVEKKRVVIDYVEEEMEVTKRVPVTSIEEKEYTRTEIRYRNVPRTEIVKIPYYEYVEEVDKDPHVLLKPEVLEKTRTVAVDEIDYKTVPSNYNQPSIEQYVEKTTIPETYTVAVPRVVRVLEYDIVSEPYEEDVVISWETRKQVPRDVKKQYTVKIPYIENIPRQYKVKVPVQTMVKGERFVPKQISRTKYQTVKRDVGKWVTTICTIPTLEIEADRCGCSTCCPRNRTVRKTVWQPKIVTSKIPYTVFETVKKRVPYEYPVLKTVEETRNRMERVTRYRTETREVTLTAYDFRPDTATKTVKVRKLRQIRKPREVEIQQFDQQQRTRDVAVEKYKEREVLSPFSVKSEFPIAVPKNITEKFSLYTGRDVEAARVKLKRLQPKRRYRDKEVTTIVREPYEVQVPYTEKVTIKDFKNVVKKVKVQAPRPRIETYTEKVPVVRTKIEYVKVEKRVPYVVTRKEQVMVPVKKTRTIYKTDVRTVAELKPEVYFESVKETFNRTVYKKKIRNEPVNRAVIKWVKVPKVLKKTIFKTVKKKVKRPALRRVPVRVPYQVEVRIPRQVCTMVEHTITIPVEECCVHCRWHLPGVAEATNAWIEYGGDQAGRMFWWMREESGLR